MGQHWPSAYYLSPNTLPELGRCDTGGEPTGSGKWWFPKEGTWLHLGKALPHTPSLTPPLPNAD